MGELGAAADMIPVQRQGALVRRRDRGAREKKFNFNVFVQQKWTPYLMMVTLFNSLQGLNDFADEATYRLSGNGGAERRTEPSLTTMLAAGEMPMPAPMLLAGWWGDKFNRLFLNTIETPAPEERGRCDRPAAGAPHGGHRKRLG